MKAKFTILTAAILLLAGCASSGPQPPATLDAFTNLHTVSSATVRTDVPVTVTAPVGLIFSDNFENWFKYVNDSNAYWGKVVPTALTNTVVQADTNPYFISGRVLEVMKRRFPSAEPVNDFPDAATKRKRSVILLDLRAPPTQWYGDRTTRIGIDAYFFDANATPVSKMSGDGQQHRPIGTLDAGVQYSTDAALAQLEEKIARLVKQTGG